MIRALSRLQPYTLLLIRLAVGASMVYHSWDKVYTAAAFRSGHYLAPMQNFNMFVVSLGMPAWLGYVSTLTEFIGGLFLVMGFLTRFCALLVFGNMLVAFITVNRHHGYAGSEFTISLMVMALMLFSAGSGALSVDRRLGIS
jgi:putative oxidoreductase